MDQTELEKEEIVLEKLKGPIGRIETFIIEHFDQDANIGGMCRTFAKEDDESDPMGGTLDASLAMGFVLGQLFEVTDPEVQADIEAVKQVLREERFLPYLPRERKAERR